MTTIIPTINEKSLRLAEQKVHPWGEAHPVTRYISELMSELGVKTLPSYRMLMGEHFRYNFPVIPIRSLAVFNNPEGLMAQEDCRGTKRDREVLAALARACPNENLLNPCVEVSMSQVRPVLANLLRDQRLFNNPRVTNLTDQDAPLQVRDGRHRTAALLMLFGPKSVIPAIADTAGESLALHATIGSNTGRKTRKSERAMVIGTSAELRADSAAKQFSLLRGNVGKTPVSNRIPWVIKKLLTNDHMVRGVAFAIMDMGVRQNAKVIHTGRVEEFLSDSYNKLKAHRKGEVVSYTEFINHINATLEAMEQMFFVFSRNPLPNGLTFQNMWTSYMSSFYGRTIASYLLRGVPAAKAGADFASVWLMVAENTPKNTLVQSNPAALEKLVAPFAKVG